MKKLHKNILFAAAVLAMPSALADIPESSVPAAAVSSIKGAYPNAGPIEWDSECMAWKGSTKPNLELTDSSLT